LGAIVAASTLAAAALAATHAKQQPKLDTVTIAWAPFQDVNSMYVGIEKGIFAKHGIQFNIQHTTWPNGNLAVIGGHADLGGFADAEVVAANAKGQDISLVLPLFQFAGGAMMYDPKKFPQWHDYNYFLKQSNGNRTVALRKTLEQMAGKKIGMLIPGGEYTALIEMSKAAGIDFKKFKLVNLVQANLPPALFSGSIDLMAGGIPQRLTALNHGYKALYDATALPSTVQSDGFGAKTSWAKSHFQTLVNIQKGIFETQQYILKHPTESFKIIAKHMAEQGTQEDPAQLPSVWNKMEYFSSSKADYMKNIASPDGRFYWKTRWQSVIDDLESSGSIKKGSVKAPLSDMYLALKVVQAT
jgi:ABC-type nitrate/sulfonate/bicarbonate transport system substrate-binding protein